MSEVQQVVLTGEALEVPELARDDARVLVDRIRSSRTVFLEHVDKAANAGKELSALVEVAYEQRAWIPLGYASWSAMLEAELDTKNLWATTEERRSLAWELSTTVGMSTRAIGDVLGISKSTAHADLATVRNRTVANEGGLEAGDERLPRPTSPIRVTNSLDGRERPRQRPTPQEVVDRGLRVAELRAEGKSQAEIGEALGVSQRTISSDERMVKTWMNDLDEDSRQRLTKGQMSRTEIGDLMGIHMVSSTATSMRRVSENGARALTSQIEFLRDSVILADAWPEERHACSSTLAPAFAIAVSHLALWLHTEIDWTHIPFEERAAATQLVEAAIARLQATCTKSTSTQ